MSISNKYICLKNITKLACFDDVGTHNQLESKGLENATLFPVPL